MHLKYKPDWEETKAPLTAWWNHEYFGRCALAVTAPLARPPKRAAPPEPKTIEDKWYNLDAIAAHNDYWHSRTFFGGEAIPMWSAGYPGIAGIPTMLGCPFKLDYYRAEIAPCLPPAVLDFHTHTWHADNWKERPWDSDKDGGRYMVTDAFYPPEQLLADGQAAFPDRAYEAVCFGYPTPAVDWEKDTAYVAAAARTHRGLWPLLLGGPALGISRDRYERALEDGGFHGFKVFLNWYGDAYGDTRIEEMVGPVERALANERRLVLLLHVPRRGRLADPEVQAGVRWLAGECPEAKIVLAHCGRCYLPGEMKAAIGCLHGLDNVWMDTSMVMDPTVLQIALNEISPGRLLFGTDFPVAAMRGRRVRVQDHWVDVVLPGYPPSAYRIAGEGFEAGPMAWEIVLAIRWACELVGVGEADRHAIFYDNGRSLLQDPCKRLGKRVQDRLKLEP